MDNRKQEILNRITTLNLKAKSYYLDDLHISIIDRQDPDIKKAYAERQKKVIAHNSRVMK